MKKRLTANAAAIAPLEHLDPLFRAEFQECISGLVAAAVRQGLEEFSAGVGFLALALEARLDEKAAFKKLGRIATILPPLVNCLLGGLTTGIQQTLKGKTPKRGKNRKPTTELVNLEIEKIVLRLGQTRLPGRMGHAVERKMLASKIFHKLSPDEQHAIIYKFGEDALIQNLLDNEQWERCIPMLVFHAVTRNKNFFERLGQALYKRSPCLSAAEEFLIQNWDEMRKPWPHPTPGLKSWRDDAVRSLLNNLFHSNQSEPLELSAYRSVRDRIGLKAEKKKTVQSCELHPETKAREVRFIIR